MAEKKSVGHAYNVDFLNVVFAASSLFLFLSVVWMVWDDFDRDWKNTQREFAQLETQVRQLNLQQAAGRSTGTSSQPSVAGNGRAEERRRKPAEGRRAAARGKAAAVSFLKPLSGQLRTKFRSLHLRANRHWSKE